MSTKFSMLIASVLTIVLGCVETTSIEAPSEVNPNVSFELTVHTELTHAANTSWGELAILIPEFWSVDSVFGDGYEYVGPLEFSGIGGWPADLFPPSIGYVWWLFYCPELLYGDSAETGYAIATIITDDSIGTFQVASIACASVEKEPWFDGVPCSCTVDVTPLNLEQKTWGYIKAEF